MRPWLGSDAAKTWQSYLIPTHMQDNELLGAEDRLSNYRIVTVFDTLFPKTTQRQQTAHRPLLCHTPCHLTRLFGSGGMPGLMF